MNNTKVFGIREVDFYKFIQKINEFYLKSKVFATQTHLDYQNNIFYAVIYYESNSQASKESDSQGKAVSSRLPPFTSSGKGIAPSFPSPDIKLITDKQKKLLEKNKDYLKEKGIDISTIKTSKMAWDILNKLFNGEI
jgi:hypothetical protein